MPTATKSLVIAGAVLFLIGLVEGALVPMFANPRMALSAHLTAVQSGTALMVLGVVWSMADWPKRLERVSFWTTVLGFFGLWLGLTFAAMSGASEALPIAGEGFRASRAIEATVSAVVIGSSVLMTIGWLLFLIALVRSRR